MTDANMTDSNMTDAKDTQTQTPDDTKTESRAFEADVAKLLHMMVHSVYSEQGRLPARADLQCRRRLREAALRGDRPPGAARRRPQAAHHHRGRRRAPGQLTVADNGIGMSRDEMVEALGTIARSGTRAFMERVEAAQGGDGAS